eukprot:tig00000767_g3957.t1
MASASIPSAGKSLCCAAELYAKTKEGPSKSVCAITEDKKIEEKCCGVYQVKEEWRSWACSGVDGQGDTRGYCRFYEGAENPWQCWGADIVVGGGYVTTTVLVVVFVYFFIALW